MASPISSCVKPIFLSCVPYLLLAEFITFKFIKNLDVPPWTLSPNPASISLLLATKPVISFMLNPAEVLAVIICVMLPPKLTPDLVKTWYCPT